MGTVNVAGVSPVVVARWAARLLAAALFLFWGAFFVAHLSEWYTHPAGWPPLWVTALMGLHFLMLLGLVLGWRWELAGGLLVLAAGVPFFALAAGRNAVPFAASVAVPAVLWLYCGWPSRLRHASATRR